MSKTKGLEALAEYIFYKNYSQAKEDGTLETWDESLDRIYGMHRNFLLSKRYDMNRLQPILDRAKEYESKKKFLSSQRNRQWASKKFTEGTLKNHLRGYNCSSTLMDSIDTFSEVMYILLAGCGVGINYHKGHTSKLPSVASEIKIVPTLYSIEDSCEGIADAIKVLMQAIFSTGDVPTFDYNQIRPKGSLIAGKFKASGPEPLKTTINNILNVAKEAVGRKMTTLELHRCICYIAESVVSAGVRRSSLIALFDRDDQDMIACKTGNWYESNRELAMANNSIIVLFGEEMSYDTYKALFEYTKEYGEPNIAKFIGYDYAGNPLRVAA